MMGFKMNDCVDLITSSKNFVKMINQLHIHVYCLKYKGLVEDHVVQSR